MFGLSSTAALAFIILLMLVAIISVLYVLYLIFFWFFKKTKLENNGSELIKQMLTESKIKKIIIGRRTYVSISKTYNKTLRMIILPNKFYIKNNYFIAYDSFLIFNNFFQMEHQHKNVFRWLKVISWFFVLSLLLFLVNIILIAIVNSNAGSLDQELDIYIEYFSFFGVFFLIMSWFLWVSSVERLREKVIKIAEQFLKPQEVKKIKFLSAFKAIVPLSNNFLY